MESVTVNSGSPTLTQNWNGSNECSCLFVWWIVATQAAAKDSLTKCLLLVGDLLLLRASSGFLCSEGQIRESRCVVECAGQSRDREWVSVSESGDSAQPLWWQKARGTWLQLLQLGQWGVRARGRISHVQSCGTDLLMESHVAFHSVIGALLVTCVCVCVCFIEPSPVSSTEPVSPPLNLCPPLGTFKPWQTLLCVWVAPWRSKLTRIGLNVSHRMLFATDWKRLRKSA